MANKKNLAAGIVANNPGTSGTSLVLEAGYGQTMPPVPFYLTLTPAGQLSTLGNSEIVEVTNVSTDTLTIVRAQKGTEAKDISEGWVAVNGVYEDDLAGGGIVVQDTPPENTDLLWIDTDEPAPNNTLRTVMEMVYPVGSPYWNATDPRNPAEIFGFGTWQALEGVVLGGISTSGPFNVAAGTIIGEDEHTLTEGEMPSHDHTGKTHSSDVTATSATGIVNDVLTGHRPVHKSGGTWHQITISGSGHTHNIPESGGDQPHNNIQRTKVGYLWERIA